MGCSTFLQDLREQFRLRKFTLNGSDPSLFLTFQWQRQGQTTSLWYVIYRWFWAVYHISWWIYTLVDSNHLDYYMIMLTNNTYILLTILTTYWAILATYYHLEYKKKSTLKNKLTIPLKILWMLQEAAFLSSFIVTAAYWAAVYNPKVPIDTGNAVVHICNSVYVLIDLLVSATPVNILHFYIPLTYLGSYLIFTVIYWAAGGTTSTGSHAIYPIMDWENLKVTLPFVILTAVFSPVIQGVVWLIYELRLLTWGRGKSRNYGISNDPNSAHHHTSSNGELSQVPNGKNPQVEIV